MRMLVWTIACLVGAFVGSSIAWSAPLDPANVPQNAKWVVHLDWEALSDSALAEKLRNDKPEITEIFRQWMQDHCGIDPQEDLKGMTLFSENYQAHTGAVVLSTAYDRQKVLENIHAKQGLQTTEWEEHTLYTWEMNKQGQQHEGQQQGASTRQDATQSPSQSPASADEEHSYAVTAVLLDDDTLVFASSEQRVKDVVAVLKGDAPSLKGQDSMLIAEMPENAIFYGAAIQLQDIAQREGVFPILQQHQHVVWAIGGAEGELYENLVLKAHKEQTATQMKQALEGFVALAKVWTAGTEHMAPLYDNVEIRQEGDTVRLEWRGQSDEVVAALDEFASRIARRPDSPHQQR